MEKFYKTDMNARKGYIERNKDVFNNDEIIKWEIDI